MTTPTHYGHFPPEFEPYKICNNANLNGNLQQIFQYAARRKHKENEIEDLKKALDFVRFEEERIKAWAKSGSMQDMFILDTKYHEEIQYYLLGNDVFLFQIYQAFFKFSDKKCNRLKSLIQNEIARLEL